MENNGKSVERGQGHRGMRDEGGGGSGYGGIYYL